MEVFTLLFCLLLVGYSEHMPFDDFLRGFQILQSHENRCQTDGDRRKVVLVDFYLYHVGPMWFHA